MIDWENSSSVLRVSTVPQSPPTAATGGSYSLIVKKALIEAAQHPAPLALHPTSSAPDLLLGPQLINTSSSDPSILTISSHFSLMHSLVMRHLGHGPGRCWGRGRGLAKGVSLLSQDTMLTL